jgi:hypothetical protein
MCDSKTSFQASNFNPITFVLVAMFCRAKLKFIGDICESTYLLFRLKNEITRLTVVKALIRIASSELKIDLRPILAESLPILAGFLRKNQRALKLSSLALLDILVRGLLFSNLVVKLI